MAFGFRLVVLTAPQIAARAALVTGALGLTVTVTIGLTLISPPDVANLRPESPREVDFEVDLPLSHDPGGFVALAAGVGIIVATGLALHGDRRRLLG